MPMSDSAVSDQADWSDLPALTCTNPNVDHSRITANWLDDDFLQWSRRQSEAEIVPESDE